MFTSYDQLKEAIGHRMQDQLNLAITLSDAQPTQEYLDAVEQLKQAQGLQALTQGMLSQGGTDPIAALKAKVQELEPKGEQVWARFKRIPLDTWAELTTKQLTPSEQYSQLLPTTFVGLFGDADGTILLTADPEALDLAKGLFEGATLGNIVNQFMTWQNTSAKVALAPTKSGSV